MAITVKGVKVRSEEVINLEVKFQDLTEEGQKRVFLENKEDFLFDALKSKYPTVRGLLWEEKVLETCSAAVLNEAIEFCRMYQHKELGDIIVLVKAVGSELSERSRSFIIHSSLDGSEDEEVKVLLAQDEKTSLKLLEDYHMFTVAAKQFTRSNNSRLFDAIVMNPNFRISKRIEKTIRDYGCSSIEKMIRERIEQKMKK